VREDIIDMFQLGYSPEERDIFSRQAINQGYRKEFLVKSGLSVESGERLYDRFSGRVIFPIHGLSGSVIGFGGRTLRSDKNIAKYLNSPESEIYHKSRVLYGLYFAKKAIVNENKCYLVEGYTDVLAMHQAGITNVVASSGTALTVEQIRLIKRFTPNVTIIYDGDAAGIKASFRGIDLVLEEGLNVRVLLLPDGEDPDSFARNNSYSQLKEFIAASEKDFISFKTSILLKDAENDPVKRAGLISDIVRSISVIPGTIERSVYIKECSNIMQVDERVLYSEVNKIRRRELEKKWQREGNVQTVSDTPVQPVVPSFVNNVYSEYEERDVIYFLLKFGRHTLRIGDDRDEIKVAEYIIREVQNENLEFTNLIYKKIFEDALYLIEKGEDIEEKHFIFHDDKKVQELAVDIFTSRYEISKVWRRKNTYIELPGDNLGEEVPKALLAYKNRIIANALQDRHEQIRAHNPEDFEGIRNIMLQFQSLKEIQKIISKELGERVFPV
jgi:DNA primase